MTNCNKCGYAIKQATVTFQDNKYHPECFVCYQCKNQLSGKSIRQHNGNNYDQDCYAVHHSERCGKCGNPCAEPNVTYTTYGGKTFHQHCFTCFKCGKSLTGGKKFYLEGDAKVCEPCHWFSYLWIVTLTCSHTIYNWLPECITKRCCSSSSQTT